LSAKAKSENEAVFTISPSIIIDIKINLKFIQI
jgi:hypothetical protein